MPDLTPLTNIAPFINRKDELRFLSSWIHEEPKNILFIYGPKSSGKTTLIYRFIKEHIENKHYDIKHFNLREMLLVNYESFLKAFFERKPSETVKETRQYDLKVFKLAVETIKGLENRELDPFVVMKREMEKHIKKGKRPVIIIDELQALEAIYFNGQRELLKKMFNFFVAMTKESHLCHVIIASSDGYFIDRIYNDSKLKKTSHLMEVDYLRHGDVMDWLANLQTYSRIDSYVLTRQQQQAIWDFFGGSCWEISNFLGELLIKANNQKIDHEDFDELLETRRVAARSLFEEHATLDPPREAFWMTVADIIHDHPQKRFKLKDLAPLVADTTWSQADLKKELAELVRQNFLSYAPPQAEYALQGRSMEEGLLAFDQEMRASSGM